MAHRPDPLIDVGPARSADAWPVLAALAVLEVAWLSWIFLQPLPNAKNSGGTITRALLLAHALPEVVPGVTIHQSHLGRMAEELGHVEHLPQRGPIVLAGLLIAGAAIGLGRLVLRGLRLDRVLHRAERLPLAFLLGAIGLGIVTLFLGRMGCLSPWPIRVGLGALAASGAVVEWAGMRGSRRFGSRESPRRLGPGLGFAIVVGPFLVLMALGAMLPTIDFDALEYHLQGPKEYFRAGRISFLPHNVYTSMPFGVEMLHLLGMVVLGDWWRGAMVGQLLVMMHAPVAAAFVALAAGRWGSSRAAWIAAATYLTTPWVYRLAVIPYVEGPLCAYHAALIYLGGRAWSSTSSSRSRVPGRPDFSRPKRPPRRWPRPTPGPRPTEVGPTRDIGRENEDPFRGGRPERSAVRLWGVVGALAGGAMACKYPALISAVVPFGGLAVAAAISRRSSGIVPAFAIGLAVAVGPWLAKNVADTGNPVYPLAYRVFGARHWDASRDAKWSAAHGRRSISAWALADGLLDVAGRSDWQSPVFLALAPLALLRPGPRKVAWILVSYVAYLFGTWWLLTHRLDRFWLPLLPALAILAGLGADWTRRRAWTALLTLILAPSILVNLSDVSTALAGLNDWTADLSRLRDTVPATINPPLARLDAALPPGAKLLLVGQASVFHLRHPIIYNTVFNDEILETVAKGRSPEQVRRELARLGVTHVYVDWSEIARYRSPGNYGFTPFVTPERLDGLVRAGVLRPPARWGTRQELYGVSR